MFFKVLSQIKDERKVIIIFAVIIALIIGFIQLVNKEITDNNSSSSINTTTAINANANNNSSIVVSNTTNTNTNQNNATLEQPTINTVADCINTFVYYCNNKQIDEAYNMLTDECKNLLYNTKDEFYKNYYMKIFNGTQKDISYVANKYNSNIYKITYKEDPLATGNASADNNIVDNVTAVNVNGTYKLNISNLIKKQNLNITKSNNFLDITVLNKTVYTDYEIYTIKAKNKTTVDMVLSELNDKKEISIQDTDGKNYYIAVDEYIKEQLTISPDKELTVSLKIQKNYNKTEATKISFSKIRLINKQYYDSNTIASSDESGGVTYETKYTSYIPEFSFEINLQ